MDHISGLTIRGLRAVCLNVRWPDGEKSREKVSSSRRDISRPQSVVTSTPPARLRFTTPSPSSAEFNQVPITQSITFRLRRNLRNQPFTQDGERLHFISVRLGKP